MYVMLVPILGFLLQSPSPTVKPELLAIQNGATTSRKEIPKGKSNNQLQRPAGRNAHIPPSTENLSEEGNSQKQPSNGAYKVDIVTKPAPPQDTPLFSLYIWITAIGVLVNALIWFLILQQTRLNAAQVRTTLMAIKVSARSANAAKRSADAAQQTVGFLDKQVIEMQKAAEAAKNSAEAALLSMKALINSERAWLVIRFTVDGRFKADVINEGRTPAEVIWGDPKWAYCITEELDTFDVFVHTPDRQFAHRKVLVPGERWNFFYSFDMKEILSSEQLAYIAANTHRLVLFGVIQYRDTLNDADATIHETRYCYWFNPTTGDLSMGGPPGANRHT